MGRQDIAVEGGNQLRVVVSRLGGELLHNVVKLFERAFTQNVEGAPGGFLRRNLGVAQPAAICVRKEVVLRAYRSIHAAQVDTRRQRSRSEERRVGKGGGAR